MSLERRETLAINLTALPVLVPGILSMFLQAIPAPLPGGGNGYLAALALAAIYAALQFPVIGWARRWKPLDYPFAWAAAFVIATMVYSISFWPMLRVGLPWVAAIVAGTPHTQQYFMHTKADPGPRSLCDYKLLGGPLPDAPFPGHYLCLTRAQYLQAPDSPVQVTLAGDRTALGMRVRAILAIEPTPNP